MNHDVPAGPLDHCQITGSDNLHLIIDLGHQPLCDALVSEDGLRACETTYPLSLYLCPESGLAQLGYVVAGTAVYPPSYPYRSSVSAALVTYQQALGLDLARMAPPNGFAVDIGSNDGTLLAAMQAAGMRVLGVEPTDAAAHANASGVPTLQRMFDVDTAIDILADHGYPDIVTMTNVFAHMADLGSVMRGVRNLIADKGIFVTESHYLLDVLEQQQFDTIYHEHVRTYSLKSICLLAAQYGLEVFRVERGTRYSGNIRAYIAPADAYTVEPSVGKLLAHELAAGLYEPAMWSAWADRVRTQRSRMMEWLHTRQLKGDAVGGVSAPGRAATLLNYYGIDQDLVPYLAEPAASIKIGQYMPGCRIPIVPNTKLAKWQPEYLVLFAWHYASVITQRLRAEGVRSKLVVPLPEFKVLVD